jgi:cupin 2 domain-containing protein
MPPRIDSLFAALPSPEAGEDFLTLLRRPGLHIERIVSSPRPASTLYDQDGDEWVVLLQGEATLELDGEPLTLRAGDHLLIPAHLPHRVLATSASPRCIWLAVHMQPQPATPDTPS